MAFARTARGRYVDVAMQASMLAALSPRMGESLQAGTAPVRLGNQNPMRVPSDVYPTKDGVELFVMVQNQRVWQPLCRALGRPGWHEDAALRVQRASGQESGCELNRLVADRIAEMPSAEVMSRMEAERVPFARVNDYARALADPQVAHRGQIRTVEHPTSGQIRVSWPSMDHIGCGVRHPACAPPLLDRAPRSRFFETGWSGTKRPSPAFAPPIPIRDRAISEAGPPRHVRSHPTTRKPVE